MDSYSDEYEFGPEHIPMFQSVVGMFERKPAFQRMVRLGILANMGYNVEYDDTGAEDYDYFDDLVHRPNRSRVSSSSPQAVPCDRGATNANAENVGASKEEEKAEKKRLKRQKRKERRQNEKEKEEQTANKKEEEKDAKKAENEKPKPDVRDEAAAKESGVSDEELSNSEELDMSSTFVSKAISKLEQKPKAEKERKIPTKEPKRDGEAAKKPACPRSQSVEDNIQRSTRLANLGNKHANDGDFKKAVLFYTDAIKHNPREYKLFGNRSFCFERMRLYMKALDDAELSLIMCPGWVKGLFRKGKALAGLKRYEEAERAFRQVLQADGSRVDASEELKRVQMAQIMGYGYTVEQSVRALNAHKSVKRALQFLNSCSHQPASESSVSSLNPPGTAGQEKWPPPPASQSSHLQKERYPIWVGNLLGSVSESSLEQLFQKVGPVDSVRLLTFKRCAFVNFTNPEDCEEAIRCFNGFEWNGVKITVRYPERLPQGMGISSTALTSEDNM